MPYIRGASSRWRRGTGCCRRVPSRASFTAGEIRVFAVLQDVSDIGEMEADEVDRDQLA